MKYVSIKKIFRAFLKKNFIGYSTQFIRTSANAPQVTPIGQTGKPSRPISLTNCSYSSRG